MAPPPAKRQKKLKVLSSEDEGDEDVTSSPHKDHSAPTGTATSSGARRSLPTRSRTKVDFTATHDEKDTLQRSSPRKTKHTSRKENTKPISTFFTSSYQPHQLSQRAPDRPNHDVDGEVEDLIEDVSPDDEVEEQRKNHKTTRAVLDCRKRPLEDKSLNGRQKFKLESNKASTRSEEPGRDKEVDSRPWVHRYGPQTIEELAVHKKKVLDVRHWFENVFQGRDRKRLLLLKGPSGTGKTATISTLAKAMNFELSEWRNPVGSEYSSEGYTSMSAQFDEFIERSGRFSSLDLGNAEGKEIQASKSGAKELESRNRVILLEEFPSTFSSTSSALQSFRSSVLEYLATSTPSLGSILAKKQSTNVTPLVMIITETRLTTTTAACDSFTAHRLLGADILNHPGVSVIEYNPIAPTLLTKALDLVVLKEARQSGRRRVPGLSVLKHLGEVGDIRSAIGSLEFLCVRGEDGDDWGGRVASKTKKGSDASSAITKMEKSSLEMVAQRESSLGLFHAVGKVVYNKRDHATAPLAQPPRHLPEHVRNTVSQVSVDSLINETGTDTETFLAALQENYVLSCEGPSFIDTITNCVDVLSDSDILNSSQNSNFISQRDYGGRSFQGAASDSLRQDEICFHLAVRGLLFSLPNPVKRRTHPVAGKGGAKNDTHKMYYPTSMRLSRQIEEIDGHVDRWMDRLRVGGVAQSKQPQNAGGKQFANMISKSKAHGPANSSKDPQHENQDGAELIRTNLSCIKTELLLERLPYITKIEAKRNPGSSTLRELEKITQFHGIDITDSDVSDDEDTSELAAPMADWTTDPPADIKSKAAAVHLSLGATQVGKDKDMTLVLPVEEEVEKMYLSEDDIED